MANKEDPGKSSRLKFSRLGLSQSQNAALLRSNTQLPRSQISRFFSNPSTNANGGTSTMENVLLQNLDKNSETILNDCDKNEQSNKKNVVTERSSKMTHNENTEQSERTKTKVLQRNEEISSSDSKSTIKSFFSNEKNDSLSDFEIPSKVAKRVPKIMPSKSSKVSRSRRKQPDIRKALGKRDANEIDYSHLPEDAQMELALAISKADSDVNSNDDPLSLDSYKFKPTKSMANGDFYDFFNMPKKKNARFKWNSKCTQLTRRKDDIQKSKIQNKVDELLLNNIIIESSQREKITKETNYFNLPDYNPSEIYSKRLQRICISERILFEMNGHKEHSNGNILSYYTNNLVERSKVQAGVLLKDWSKIAGRDSIYDGVKCSTPENQENEFPSQSALEADYDNEDIETVHRSGILEQDEQQEQMQYEENSRDQFNSYDNNNEIQTNVEMPEDIDIASLEGDGDATIVMDANDIQLKVDTINTKIRLSKNFCDIFHPALVTYESTSSIRATSPDLFDDDDDDDFDMVEEIQTVSIKTKPNDEDTVEAALSDIIVISSNELNSVSNKSTQSISQIINSEEIVNNDNVETIELLDSDSENMLKEQPIDCLFEGLPIATTSQVEANIEISDDECDFIKPENVSLTQNMSTKSNGTSSLTKKLSFTERLELFEKDLLNGFTDDIPAEYLNRSQLNQSQELAQSQESIVLSDDEINYSMNEGGVHVMEDDLNEDEDYYNCYIPSPIEFNLVESTSYAETDEKLVNQSVCNILEKTFEHASSPISTLTKRKSAGAKTLKKVNSDMVLESHYNHDIPSASTSNLKLTPQKSYKMIDFNSPVKQRNSPLSQKTIETRMDLSNDEYCIRVGCVTPKPNYDEMDTNALEMELRKFGLKPALRRRQAIICLEYIYNRTHPFMENTSDSENPPKSQRIKESKDIPDSTDVISDPKINYNIGFAVHGLVDEKFKRKEVTKVFLPSALRAKKPWCLEPLHIAWHNLIMANSEIHKAVLLYEPINLIELKKFFKTIDMTFDNRDLISFLDLHCITFRMNKASKE